MENKNCPFCGGTSDGAAKFCSLCGNPLKNRESVSERVFLGDYELMAFDNEPPGAADWGDEPIFDRDEPGSASLKKEIIASGRRGLIHLVLIALLLVLGVAAYAGIQTVAARREAKAAELVRQAQVQQAAEAKAEREAYVKTWREFMIMAQAQSQAFALNLEELARIEKQRWLTNVFLGGIFDGMVDRFRASDDYLAMAQRQADLAKRFEALAEPPPGARDLAGETKDLQTLSGAVYDLFAGDYSEASAEEIRLALENYDEALTGAQAAD